MRRGRGTLTFCRPLFFASSPSAPAGWTSGCNVRIDLKRGGFGGASRCHPAPGIVHTCVWPHGMRALQRAALYTRVDLCRAWPVTRMLQA